MKSKIKWNKVTWYSKGIALVLVTALPMVAFVLGYKQGKKQAEIKYKGNIGERSVNISTTTKDVNQ